VVNAYYWSEADVLPHEEIPASEQSAAVADTVVAAILSPYSHDAPRRYPAGAIEDAPGMVYSTPSVLSRRPNQDGGT
jgi:hypothetical protein